VSEPRQLVLWFGPAPSDEARQAFLERDLGVVEVDLDGLTDDLLIGACGVVYNVTGRSLGDMRLATEKTLGRTADHGLRAYVVAANDTIQGYMPDLLDPLEVCPAPVCKTAPPSYRIAETLARHNPGRPRSTTLALAPCEIVNELATVDRLLLERAFSDCVRLDLERLPGGRTAEVLMVYATFRDSVVGPRPLPFFAKLGARDKIAREIDLYDQFATHFIPFHLRPNLDATRCLLGTARGILVGNFVERSESLSDLARRGRAGAAIQGLFDVTLAGWRTQAYAETAVPISGPIAGAMKGLFDYKRTAKAHRTYANAFGIEVTPQELWEGLIGLSDQVHRRAPMHGDLHGDNVRVRNGDAILIDLASIEHGPLAADPASLEVSLVFEPQGTNLDPAIEANWRSAVDTLYAPAAFEALPRPRFETESDAAMWNSVRQVRRIALTDQACSNEYATAAAVYLLRRTMYDGDTSVDSERRGYAYVTAARLIEYLVKSGRNP
jgi:hypothetical protein